MTWRSARAGSSPSVWISAMRLMARTGFWPSSRPARREHRQLYPADAPAADHAHLCARHRRECWFHRRRRHHRHPGAGPTSGVVLDGASGVTLAGTFSGNGSGLNSRSMRRLSAPEFARRAVERERQPAGEQHSVGGDRRRHHRPGRLELGGGRRVVDGERREPSSARRQCRHRHRRARLEVARRRFSSK